MTHLTFQEFQVQFFDLHRQGAYSEAEALLDRAGANFPERGGTLANWRICDDPDLASLQGRPEFERLLSRSMQLQAEAEEISRPELLTFMPFQDETPMRGIATPLLLALHGRNGNARDFAPFWQGMADQGWIVAVAQSSQMLGDLVYGWENWERAVHEILDHFAGLSERFTLDTRRLILGGFSQGGGLAIWLALTQALPVKGFIGVAPYVPDIALLAEKVKSDSLNSLRGYLITGRRDQGQAMFAQIETLLQDLHLPYQREDHSDLGHEFPPDFKARLPQILAYLCADNSHPQTSAQ